MKSFTIPTFFKIGEYYTNDQLQYALDIGNAGGIRPKLKADKSLDFIVLITSQEENKKAARNPYADSIEGDILTYTGAGLTGEQVISGVNKRLLEQRDVAVPILGFVKEKTNVYRFIGLLFLLRHYWDYQLDQEGSMRKVLLFEFQILSEVPLLPVGTFTDVFIPSYDALKKNFSESDSIVVDSADSNVVIDEVDDLKKVEKMKSELMLIDPYVFEVVVSKLVSHVGFSDVKVTKKSGDDGVDINATLRNPISTDLQFLFQVKRWKHSVGRNEVANLRGSMGLNNQGVIIATSHFTASAINEAKAVNKVPVNLIGIHDLYGIVTRTGFDIEKQI